MEENSTNQKSTTSWTDYVGNDEPSLLGLSDKVKDVVTNLAQHYKVPIDFILAPLMAAVSTAVGSTASIYDGMYTNTLSLWIALVADSGTNKSEPAETIFKALRDIDNKLGDIYNLEKKEYKKKQLQKKKKSEIDEDESEPIRKTLISNIITDEKRDILLSNNPHGVLQYNDEIRTFYANLGRYTGVSDIGVLLSIADNRTYSRDTIGRGYIKIQNPYMTIYGGIQRQVAKKYFVTEDSCESGLTSRFIFFYPKSVTYPHDRGGGNPTLYNICVDTIHTWITDIYNRSKNYDNTDNKRLFTVSDAAINLYNNFFLEGSKIQNTSDSNAEKSAVAKVKKLVWRFAAIAHLINEQAKFITSDIINDNEMLWAINLGKYFYRRYMMLIEGTEVTGKTAMQRDAVKAIVRINPTAGPKAIANILNLSESTVKNYMYRDSKS